MTVKEIFDSFLYRLKSFFRNEENDDNQITEPNLTSGGYSGYRPGRGDIFSNDSLQRKDKQNPQQTAQQDASQYSGYDYQSQMNGQPNPEYSNQQGYNGYAQQDYGNQPYNGEPYPQQGTQENQQPSNISYMPNQFIGDDGCAYAHCERVMQVNCLNACFRVIDCMRNRESVVISTESIGNEEECRRCIDIINGAAYTMQCSMTRVSQQQRIYLVAPNNVMVVKDAAVTQWVDKDAPQPWQAEPMPYVQVPPRQINYEQPVQNAQQAAGAYWDNNRAQSAGGYNNNGYSQQAAYAEENSVNYRAAAGAYQSDTRKGVYGNPAPQMGFGGH